MKIFLPTLCALFLLIACGGEDSDAPTTEMIDPDSGDALMGATLYQENCTRCHGNDGQGGTPSTEGVTANITFADADRIQTVVRTQGPEIMPLFDMEDITTEELNDLIAFVLAEWPN